RARAEGHARLDAYDYPARDLFDLAPRRRDDEAPDLDRAPTLLPLREPVALLDLAQTHPAHVRRREAVDAKGFDERRAHALDRGRRVEVRDDVRARIFPGAVVSLGLSGACVRCGRVGRGVALSAERACLH